MHREAAAKRPGVLTKIGMDTFVDPKREGCAMNAKARAAPIVSRVHFAGDDWLFFPTIVPTVAIIRAILELGSSLGMITTAEGVETEEQLDILRAEGCMQAQGYLFSRPKPAAEIPFMLRHLQPRVRAA